MKKAEVRSPGGTKHAAQSYRPTGRRVNGSHSQISSRFIGFLPPCQPVQLTRMVVPSGGLD